MVRTVCAILAVGAALGMLSGCGNASQPKEITQKRVMVKPEPAPAASAPASNRGAPPTLPKGHPPIASSPMGDTSDPHGMMAGPLMTDKPFDWTLPAGWEEAPPTSMRLANFKIASSPDSECYVSLLQGGGGGLGANVNRWRGQMGQTELSAEDLAALPKIDILGIASPMAEIPGNYGGMSGAAKASYLMFGVVTELPGRTVFIKMTGPESDLRAQKDAFVALCKSLKEAK